DHVPAAHDHRDLGADRALLRPSVRDPAAAALGPDVHRIDGGGDAAPHRGEPLRMEVAPLVLNIAAPLLMLALLYLLNMAWGFFMETRSRRLITGLFGTYVPKELVDEMSKNPEEYSMRGESRVMTVLFSDVRDFTSISEGLTPEGLKDMMNAYLTAMTEVIQQARGTIDKYIGHAIMSFWGAPLSDPDHT